MTLFFDFLFHQDRFNKKNGLVENFNSVFMCWYSEC